MSGGIKYCNICKNFGLDFKMGKFYCSLSHRPDKLPDVLSCDEFCLCTYVKHLEQENKELKEKVESYNCNADCYKYKEAEKYRKTLYKIQDILTQPEKRTIDFARSEMSYTIGSLYFLIEKECKVLIELDEVLKNNVEAN